MLMKKGVDALQMVFAMFILIVVTLVVIRLFTGIVKPGSLPNINDFKDTYNYDREVSSCESLCGSYTASECSDYASAVSFCQKQISIDIDGNFKTGEKRHFGIVNGIPYCEDGLYCFHIVRNCGCRGYYLDAATCRVIMLDYYKDTIGFSDETAKSTICKYISPGDCEKDPTKWTGLSLPTGFQPQPALGDDTKYATNGYIGADYWWKKAGYLDIGCGQTTSGGGLTLSCTNPAGTKDIKCSWTGCTGNTDVYVAYSGPGSGVCYSGKLGSGECTISNLNSGNYNIALDCDGSGKSTPVTLS